jgi:hypothetical protein
MLETEKGSERAAYNGRSKIVSKGSRPIGLNDSLEGGPRLRGVKGLSRVLT